MNTRDCFKIEYFDCDKRKISEKYPVRAKDIWVFWKASLLLIRQFQSAQSKISIQAIQVSAGGLSRVVCEQCLHRVAHENAVCLKLGCAKPRFNKC